MQLVVWSEDLQAELLEVAVEGKGPPQTEALHDYEAQGVDV